MLTAKKRSVSFPLGLCLSLIFAFPASLHSIEVRFDPVKQEEVRRRLESYEGDNRRRERTLKGLFEAAGCTSEMLSEQHVKLQEPNLICSLPGTTDSIIVVGAHFDHAGGGNGVVDNWSGASLLPSLFEVLKQQPRKHTFIFIAFAGEEMGLIGSKFYVKNLAPEQAMKIRAMVNMDTLGLGPTAVWVSRSDPKLRVSMAQVAQAMKLPVTGVNVEQVGRSDEEPFRQRTIPTITIHSLTQATLNILHSPSDQLRAIKFDDYYNTYRLISGYLIFLDQKLGSAPAGEPQKQ